MEETSPLFEVRGQGSEVRGDSLEQPRGLLALRLKYPALHRSQRSPSMFALHTHAPV